MSNTCCVEGCDANNKKNITYFQLPVKPALRRKWREAMSSAINLSTYSLICSQHFGACDYQTVRGRVRLKANVVPSVFQTVPNKTPPKKPIENSNGKPVNRVKKKITKTRGKPPPEKEESDDQEICVQDNNVDTIILAPEIEFDGCHDESLDENGEVKCTIECVPESILAQDSDSNSETELHKEDIEDIIANYHIKQNKKIAARLQPPEEPTNHVSDKPDKDAAKSEDNSQSNHNNSQLNRDKSPSNRGDSQSKHNNSQLNRENSQSNRDNSQSNRYDSQLNHNNSQSNRDNSQLNRDNGQLNRNDSKLDHETGKFNKDSGDKRQSVPPDKHTEDSSDDVIEIEPVPDKEPVFIEISVDAVDAAVDSNREQDDCLMVMESVQVDVDPATLLASRDDDLDTSKKDDPISLLTSSDEDDVILEEPHIDTVEVSDESSSEDDMPLVKFCKNKNETLKKVLWGRLVEYYCYQCTFSTTNKGELERHKHRHSTVIQMCEVCNFTSASKAQFSRHKKKHKDEKRFKCHQCDYRAKHKMSLTYHMKSHECKGSSLTPAKLKCKNCRFCTNQKSELQRHHMTCIKVNMFGCDVCKYETKRRSDLRRHMDRRHGREPANEVDEVSEGNED